MVNDFDYYLFSPTKFRVGSLRFFRLLSLPAFGYASLYAVNETTAKALEQAGTTEGFAGVVWNPFLWIDCDDEESRERTEGVLNAKGLEYTRFHTGNRGLHFRVPRDCDPSHLLPAFDKAWVDLHLGGADLSLYSHLHWLRQGGARHEKTGQVKKEISHVPGRNLRLAELQEAASRRVLTSSTLTSSTDFECVSILDDLQARSLLTPADNGRRHQQLYQLAGRLHEMGREPEFVRGLLKEVNLLFSEQKPEEELEKILMHWFG